MRVFLSILAVVFDVGLILIALLGAIGFGYEVANNQLSGSSWLGVGMMSLVGVGGAVNILAIAVGARLRDRSKAQAADVASEFS
jgi:hypothetical protein